jgi:heme exporter protein B
LAHWLTTALPLIALAPVLGLILNLAPQAYGVLVATMLVGTPPSASSARSARP